MCSIVVINLVFLNFKIYKQGRTVTRAVSKGSTEIAEEVLEAPLVRVENDHFGLLILSLLFDHVLKALDVPRVHFWLGLLVD